MRKREKRGIVDALAGRIGSEGNGTASALSERSYSTAFSRKRIGKVLTHRLPGLILKVRWIETVGHKKII